MNGLNIKSENWFYFIFRLAFGLNFFMAGVLSSEGLMHPLPFSETILGALLILGLFTNLAITLSMLVLVYIMFNACLKSGWSLVHFQMVYLIYSYLLGVDLDKNKISIDQFRR